MPQLRDERRIPESHQSDHAHEDMVAGWLSLLQNQNPILVPQPERSLGSIRDRQVGEEASNTTGRKTLSNFYKAGAAAMTSNKDDWETPQALFDQLNEEFHFTLDAASNDQNAKCEHHYTAENSGLERSWGGGDSILQSSLRAEHRRLDTQSLPGSQQTGHSRSPIGSRPHGHQMVPEPYPAPCGSPVSARTFEV